MKLLVRWLISAVAVYVAAWLIPGIHLPDFGTAFWVALVLGLVNTFVKPLLQLISIPLIVITFGLFLLVINAIVLMFIGDVVEAFRVDGFWSAVWGSIVISAVTYLLDPPQNNEGGNNGGGGFQIRIDRR